MASQPVEILLSRLHGVRRRSPAKWHALCPVHDDHEPSLSVGEGADGRALLRCHAGCDTREIVSKLGLAMRDLFPRRSGRKVKAAQTDEGREPLTVRKLAEYFQLDDRRLIANGVEDVDDGVLIRYHDPDGRLLTRERIRSNLHGSERFKWRGTGPIFPYGLQHLALWRELGPAPYLVLVEGESDVWAGWEHGVPALGVPGATQARCLRREFVEGFNRLYILREPDDGGHIFVTMVPTQLAKMGWSGDLLELQLSGAKDLAELHRQDRARFGTRLKDALREARKLILPNIIKAKAARKRGGRGSPRRTARQFLLRELSDGQWKSRNLLLKEAEARGIKLPTLRRAAASLAIEKRPGGFGVEWIWRLIPKPLRADEHDSTLSQILEVHPAAPLSYVGSDQL
jgi:hypothetical protein